MSAEGQTSTSAVAAPAPPPLLREARFEDYPQIYRLESTFFDDSLPPAERQSLFVDNPLWPRLRDTWPIGWVLENADGQIVGSVNNIPSSYQFAGEELICGNGHCWAVLDGYRGYATMLMDEYFSQVGPDLLISSKVGADAAPIWSAYAHRVPVGDWSTAAYTITHYASFARAALARKGVPLARALALPAAAALRLKDAVAAKALPDGPRDVEFREVDGFDARFDAFWHELVAQDPNRLTGVRDAATLRWHYGIPLRRGRVWVVAALRDGLLRGYCVLKKHHRPPDVSSMKIVDFQTLEPGSDLLAGLLKPALRRSAAENCSFIEHHGVGLPKLASFEAIAPYRAPKPSWSFFYYTDNAALEGRLADPDVWDPSEYDGDSAYK
ncbi:MAG TPA: hypothetical protein VGE11_01560 [Pseudonocardia sp.]